MNVLLFGATDMIGGGVLTECLDDDRVRSVVSLGRTPSGRRHPKLRDVVTPDLFDLGARADEIGPFDACLYCLGVSSAGMSEDASGHQRPRRLKPSALPPSLVGL